MIKGVVYTAVLKSGSALECANLELQRYKEIVLAAVVQNGLALEDASPEPLHDPDIVRYI